MARSIFSSSWHSVADLKPRLIPQARVHRHVYRNQVWYVVQDQSGGRYHRLSNGAYALVTGMDGSKTVQTLWELANAEGKGDACTQNEVVDLLVQMHAADLLQVDSAPDSTALFERYNKKRRATVKQWLLNPMSLKFPLLDPNAFLSRWAPSLAWCFTTMGALLWLTLVVPAMFLAAQHWPELTDNLSDNVLSSSNLMVMALVFPAVKLLHELGHGFATKVWGGAVHEMGLMFLVFAPAPYVDASSSSAFPSKYQRAIVAAAGMLVELFVAAIALYVWLLVEPGIIRAMAYNVMVVAGFSTLVVNGNPLLRYDGYYIFTDLIEMPNLAQRGQKYLTFLWDRHVFGAQDIDPSHESKSERRWLFWYTPLAWLYRTSVTLSITLFIAGKFFIFGVVLALWGGFTLVVMPLWKAYKHVTGSATLRRRRKAALLVSLTLLVGILLLAFALPTPLYTRAEGVVWLPDQAMLRAGGNGFFRRWLVSPGVKVKDGTPLYVQEDDLLLTELAVTSAKVKEAEAKYASEQFSDPAKAAVSLRQLEGEQERQAQLQKRAANLVGYAKTDGIFVIAQPQDTPDSYFKKGDLIGYVLERKALLARVVVSQDDIDLVRTRFKSAELRLSNWIAQSYTVDLARQSAGGIDELPSAALSLSGGGTIATVPNDPNGLKTIERIFIIDLALPGDIVNIAFGERVFVRFNHGNEPLAWQGLRRLRQLFLSRFGV
jgi:putative peptide zinc metalloprotease protein